MAVARSAHPRPDPDTPVSRTEQKERTRLRLVEAALSLIGQGRSFSSLGLREVTREAGVPVPAVGSGSVQVHVN